MVMAPARETIPLVPATPALTNERPLVLSGTVSGIEKMATREDVIAFIRSHAESTSAPSSGSSVAQLVTGNTRTFRFDVDTTTFKPDEYIVTVQAVREDVTGTALFNMLDPSSAPGIPSVPPMPLPTPVSGSSVSGDFFIRIDPVPNHRIGDRFAITGTTNLPAGEELLVQVYSSSFKPTMKSQSGEFSGASGTITTSSSIPMPTAVSTMAPVHTSAPTMGQTVPQTAVPSAAATPGFSTTNVQVNQVDEADIIKTDGENIYVVSGNCLHILKAYPARDAEILSSYQFSGDPESLYINEGKVVLIAREYQSRPYRECAPGSCGGFTGYGQITHVYIFSVKDPAVPVLVRQLEIDGFATTSRMIGSRLYLVTSTGIPANLDDLQLPLVQDDHGGPTTPPVYGFDMPGQAEAFSTISSVDVLTTGPVSARTFIIGNAGTVYVSPSTLYIAVKDTAHNGAATTSIYSFAVDDGRITYLARGSVDGTLLSQYSLDEYEGNLRVATTLDAISNRWQASSSSEVTVLDRNLRALGTLSGIAPNERIYAARFMGDRLYLVTFRETDPFFVIGLADPARPKILGELKIPGYSSYLHPYDASHIIGIGKDTRSGPVKIALFDVSEVKNPKLISSQSLGGDGSYTPVLDDPKAFLFDKEKDILVLPLHLEGTYRCNAIGYDCYRTAAWGGAYVYSIRPKTGFVLKGKVTHYDEYTNDHAQVRRSLYIGDTLYTMSDSKIVMSDLAQSLERLNEVKIR